MPTDHYFRHPVVVVPVRVAFVLHRLAPLDDLPRRAREAGIALDDETLDVLDAFRRAAGYAEAAQLRNGTEPISVPELVEREADSVSSYSTAEAARLLGISDRAVRKRLDCGHLQGVKRSGQWRVTDRRLQRNEEK